MRYLLFLLFFVPCLSCSVGSSSQLVRPSKSDLDIIRNTVQVWEEAGVSEVPPICHEDVENLRFIFPKSDEEMKNLTLRCLPGCTQRYGDRTAEECPLGCSAGAFYYGVNRRPIMVIATYPDVITHETAHLLASCTGHAYRNGLPGYDPYHKLGEIWGPGGVVEVAESRLGM